MLAHPIAWLLQSLGKSIIRYQGTFFGLVERILSLTEAEIIESGNDLMFKAINHPIGLVTDAVFRWWFRQKLEDGQGLASRVEHIFTLISNVDAVFRYGRVLLGANSTALFRVDQKWTERHVLPLFSWNDDPEEACAVWIGFLWSPRLHASLLEALKVQFLATATHYEVLGECGGQ
jgi:hypothetical protein